MSRYHCPACGAALPPEASGHKVYCVCGQKVAVPGRETRTVLAMTAEQVTPPPLPLPISRRSHGVLKAVAKWAAVAGLLAVIVWAGMEIRNRLNAHNAVCPHCLKTLRLPEELRANPLLMGTCPSCGHRRSGPAFFN